MRSRQRSPIEKKNLLLNKTTPLTSREKALFGYFGVDAKIKPPLRILNPHRIFIGDQTSIQEHCHVNAFEDLSFLLDYVAPRYRGDFAEADYRYDSRIAIGRENQIGRFFFVSCTRLVELEDNVLLSERVFIGDNNHSFSHRAVPIMQQPNKKGEPVRVGYGSWVGAGAVLLAGTEIGRLSVVGANSVCNERFPDYSVIGPAPAQLLFRRFESDV
jgi:acetyltransferase-like isoleucine patch superfamily enzyme